MFLFRILDGLNKSQPVTKTGDLTKNATKSPYDSRILFPLDVSLL